MTRTSKNLHLLLFSTLAPLIGACSHHATSPGLLSADGSHVADATPAPPPEPLAPGAGLEVTSFVSSVPERSLAEALAPYLDQSPPLPREMLDAWSAHGFRLVCVPIADTGTLIRKLQTTGNTQRQWLGQAFVWTEAVRAPDGLRGDEIIALDAERIRLAPGVLRLLVRSWIEPAPPEPTVGSVITGAQHAVAPSAPAAAMWVELLPQHEEFNRDDSLHPFANLESRLDPESQGLNFSRLYARLNLSSDCALLILSEHPGTDWKQSAAQPQPDSISEGAAAPPTSSAPSSSEGTPGKGPESGASRKPRVGDVSRAPFAAPLPSPPGAPPEPADAGPGPTAVHIPTLGESMLTQQHQPLDSRGLGGSQRTLVLLTPRVPREFQLLGPANPAPSRPPPPAKAHPPAAPVPIPAHPAGPPPRASTSPAPP